MFKFIIIVLLVSTHVCLVKSLPTQQSTQDKKRLSQSVNDYFYSDVVQQIFADYHYGQETCLPLNKESCNTKKVMNLYGVICDYCVILEGETCGDVKAMSPPCDEGLFCLPTQLSMIKVERDLTNLFNLTCQRSNSFVKVVRNLPKNEVEVLLNITENTTVEEDAKIFEEAGIYNLVDELELQHTKSSSRRHNDGFNKNELPEKFKNTQEPCYHHKIHIRKMKTKKEKYWKPICDEQGSYATNIQQCSSSTNCWCVNKRGIEINGSIENCLSN